MKRPVTRLLMLPLLAWRHAPAQAGPDRLNLDEVLERMAARDSRRTADLRSYAVTRRYLLENKRFRKQAEMVVRMDFRAPDEKTFQVLFENGPSAVRHRVFRKMIEAEREAARGAERRRSEITPANYEFRLLGMDQDRGRPCYLLEARPKTRNRFLLRGRVWVDAEDFAITRIEGSPAENPSLWTRRVRFVHEYGKFGPFWLAVRNRSETDVLVFGRTEVTIEYFGYRVNEAPRPEDDTAGLSRSTLSSSQTAPVRPCCASSASP